MVRTSANAYVKYCFEDGTTFAALASGITPNKKFGLQDKVSSLASNNGKVALNQLNKNTVHKFAYGQQNVSLSVGFTLSSPWIFGAILGVPSYASNTFTYPHTTNGLNKSPRTIKTEIGFENDSDDVVREIRGGVVNALNISAAVGGLVDCTVDVTSGLEASSSITLSGTEAPTAPSQEFPYTFAHAELVINGEVAAECQDVSLNLTQNGELLYGLGSNSSVAALRKVLEMTGSFRTSWLDNTMFQKLLAQIKADSATTYQETVGIRTSPTVNAEFRLTFEENSTNQQIVITGTGLSISDHSISGLEPVEPLFEEINWQFKTITVVAKSTATAEP